MLNLFCALFLPFYSVPPVFNRPGEDADAATLPSLGGDLRDVIINNPISLYCETNAVPPPTLTWYKDGQLLTSSDKVLILPGETNQETAQEKEKYQLNSTPDFVLPRWQSAAGPQGSGRRLGQVHVRRCQRSRGGLHSVRRQSAV